MHDHIFDQVLRFLDQFSVQSDICGCVIAASPLRFHALDKIGPDLNVEPWLPLTNKRWDKLVEKGLVPFVNHGCPFFHAAAWADTESDPFVVNVDVGFGVLLNDRHQVTTSPHEMAFPLHKLTRSFPRLIAELLLLLTNPC